MFGVRLEVAIRYAESLCTTGVERGVIGPRESDRVWDRHLLNCAALSEVVPEGVRVVDVGTGAGLPGIPLALARPDLRVTLLDSQTRRMTYVSELISLLGLGGRVTPVLGRAEDHRGTYDVVTARAVAPLDKLGRWTAPLACRGGMLAAIRGSRAVEEVGASRAALKQAGWDDVTVRECGAMLAVPTTLVVGVKQ
jgi:16S rRNA (guanine527-N7)-methyltransferase